VISELAVQVANITSMFFDVSARNCETKNKTEYHRDRAENVEEFT
jgi:hypothetical protein